MAYLRIRADGRVEIRESVSTAAGPRARTLATFRGSLGPDVLERAAGRASRNFDGDALVARARERSTPAEMARLEGASDRHVGPGDQQLQAKGRQSALRFHVWDRRAEVPA